MKELKTPKPSIGELTRQWHMLRSSCFGGKRTVDDILKEYEQLEAAIGSSTPHNNEEASKQLKIALILWRECIATSEEMPEFIKNRYSAIDGMFRGVLGFISIE